MSTARSSGDACEMSRSLWARTNSPQSVGGVPGKCKRRRRHERISQVREDLPDAAGIRDERDEAKVAGTAGGGVKAPESFCGCGLVWAGHGALR
jgi:hypothetical protein